MLSVEPYGMKLAIIRWAILAVKNFSALGRAVWDETEETQEFFGEILAYISHLEDRIKRQR